MEGIKNYYEKAVVEQVELQGREFSEDEFQDIICVSLNQLPCKYIRHDVDMSFYMSEESQEVVDKRVDKAVAYAVDLVMNNPR